MIDIAERVRGRVVVAVDGSEPSRAAVTWAAEECRAKHLPLTLATCWHVPVYAGTVYEPAISADAYEEEARHTLEVAVKDVDGVGPALDVQTEVLEGPPSVRLLDLANTATEIVVGSRGRGGVAGLLLGSVSQHLVEHAACPVVVIHEP